MIVALEHYQKRQKSWWLRLTVPDYMPAIIERMQRVVRLIREGETNA